MQIWDKFEGRLIWNSKSISRRLQNPADYQKKAYIFLGRKGIGPFGLPYTAVLGISSTKQLRGLFPRSCLIL